MRVSNNDPDRPARESRPRYRGWFLEVEFCILWSLTPSARYRVQPSTIRLFSAMSRIYPIVIPVLAAFTLLRCEMNVPAQIALPPVTELPLIATLPDPLVSMAGAPITSVEDWESVRRPEIKRLFAEYMYGYLPETPENVSFEIEEVDDSFLDGQAIKK